MAKPNPSEVELVLYHANCSDGAGSSYAAWKLLGSKAKYIACRHGQPPPDVIGKNVAICDFSFDNATTKKMIEDANTLVVLDHHKSALLELHDIPEAIFDMNHSGAIITWNFFHPGKEPPKFLKYIEDRDLWSWKLPYSKEFSAAFDLVDFSHEEFAKFEDDSVFDDAVKRGSVVLAYSKTVVRRVASQARKRKYKGNDVYVVNASHWMSEIGAKLSPDCDFVFVWYYDHDIRKIKVSLRSHGDNSDVCEIAKSFGGGGHANAAGFGLPGDTIVDDLFDEVEEKVDTSAAKEELEKIKAKLVETGDSGKLEAIEMASALLSEVGEETEEIEEVKDKSE
jgi:oligoribonuclease NrnB/cAMP/cGMP phosphodiesterase (DHH superfamily)